MRTSSFADLPGAPKRWDRLFWHKVRMSRFGPDIHFAVSREIEEPFRTARCVVLHLEPFRTGIVIGWYARPTIDTDDDNAVAEHVRRAVTTRDPSERELAAFDDEKLHGPGKPGGLRFGATGSRPVGGGGPQLRVADAGPAGTDQ